MIDKLKAIADENRYRIIELLLEQKHCVRALSMRLGISEPAVSQHLKVLKECELIYGSKNGHFMHYSVNSEKLLEIAERLSNMAQKNSPSDCSLHPQETGKEK